MFNIGTKGMNFLNESGKLRWITRFRRPQSTLRSGLSLPVIHFPSYAEKMKDYLKPPVANALMFSGKQLKIMIVKGPNQRSDYHLNMGEELFYQFRGSIDVLVKEPDFNIDKAVRIDEDQVFLLPKAMPHSPQRYEGTLGVVFERTRNKLEVDGMRWYTPSNEVLYQSFFHCTDLGTQIKHAIENFQSSEEYKTQTPTPQNKVPKENKDYLESFKSILKQNNVLNSPFNLFQRVSQNSFDDVVFDSEFKMKVVSGKVNDRVISTDSLCELFLWQLQGQSVVGFDNDSGVAEKITLDEGSMTLLPYNLSNRVTVSQTSNEARFIVISNNACSVI